ncbi:hypothetical protein [Roseateles koreensis]|uniref:STAS/SEC14 domain-containing protein n=1 Tax=Roseateles koreensis TaxID=2987526 RepID=A0ABT5KVL6_9BURK|nr:hypothetical protein [Roseateles koreensis]MDC8786413.1 hypothetical protein [Roseateles koreensis]
MPLNQHRKASQFATCNFRPHGEFEFWVHGSTFHVRAQGPFNREAIEAMAQGMGALYNEIPAATPLVNLLEFTESLMIAPDALQALEDLLRRFGQLGRAPVAVAFVVEADVEGRDLVWPFYHDVFLRQGRLVKLFDNAAEAQGWLDDELQIAMQCKYA